jgi:hypothetical protein
MTEYGYDERDERLAGLRLSEFQPVRAFLSSGLPYNSREASPAASGQSNREAVRLTITKRLHYKKFKSTSLGQSRDLGSPLPPSANSAMYPRKKIGLPSSNILVPLYVYPAPGAWDPLFTASVKSLLCPSRPLLT